jgi:hypothetical protein
VYMLNVIVTHYDRSLLISRLILGLLITIMLKSTVDNDTFLSYYKARNGPGYVVLSWDSMRFLSNEQLAPCTHPNATVKHHLVDHEKFFFE